MSAFEFIDTIFCPLPFNNSVFLILAVYRSPRANPGEDDSHLIRAVNFVSQFEFECLAIGDFNAPSIDWDSQTCSVTTGFS